MKNYLILVNNKKVGGDLDLSPDELQKVKETKSCQQINLKNDNFWVIKKDNYILVDKISCLDELEQEAMLDSLTKCFNKKEGEIFLNKLLKKYLRYKNEGFSIMLIDIDYFKKINDTYGHLAGDFILKEISKLIRQELRETDLFVRFGGEEFLIILPNTKLAGAFKLASRLKEKIQNYDFKFNNVIIKVTISIGITAVTLNDSYESLISRADEALYLAKEKGRNRIEYK